MPGAKNIVTDALNSVQQWAVLTANRYGEPLLNAFVACATGAVTVALTGNVVSGIQIAATGIGRLVLEILRAQPPVAKGFALQSSSYFLRTLMLLLSPVFLLTMVVMVIIIGSYCWFMSLPQRKKKP
jgi:prolipoprotein diacylglyceryltransferase